MSNINVDNLTPLAGTSGKIGISGSILATHITASGNISASGTIYADNFNSAGGDSAGISFTDDLIITGHVTASGNISGSGTLDISGATNLDGALTVDGAGISLDSAGTAANFTVATDGAAEDLTIGLTGATDSSIVISSTGTGADAINIDTTAGSIDIDSADNITVGAADDISLTTTSADGLISLVSAHTAGDAVHIDANAAAGSIVNIDAGILDIDADDTVAIDAADEIVITTTSADGHISLVSAHTSGVAFHIDANADAASEVQIDAGVLDIDVTGAATLDAASLALTGAVTVATGIQSTAIARTATDDGTGNGTIAAGTSMVLVDADSDANHIIILPAPVVGNIIHLIETATTGYELRTSTPASIGINGGTASNGESAIAGAITYVRCVCVSSTNWICSQFDADGDESKVEAAA